jgi:low affinity Fe/Cu permease
MLPSRKYIREWEKNFMGVDMRSEEEIRSMLKKYRKQMESEDIIDRLSSEVVVGFLEWVLGERKEF